MNQSLQRLCFKSVNTATMGATLPRDMLERVLDGPFNYEEFRKRVSPYVEEKPAGQDMNSGAQPMDFGQLDNPNGGGKDVQCRAAPPTPSTQSEVEIGTRQRAQSQAAVPTPPTATSVNAARSEVRERGDNTECAQEETPNVLKV